MKNKKKIAAALLTVTMLCPVTNGAYANEQVELDTSKIYHSEVNFKGERPVSILENVTIQSRADNVNWVHDSWFDLEEEGHDALRERVCAETSCHLKSDGSPVNAYTRARYEKYGSGEPYADSGRKWDNADGIVNGYSSAKSGWVSGDLNLGTAHTYYGR